MTPTDIARVCHEANRAYCLAIGDDSQPAWEEAPDWQQASAITGVIAHLEQPRSPQESHELWLEHKRADGWRYGAEKDPIAKTHPCFVPYEALPELQRAKDELFGAVVGALRGYLGAR